MQENQESPNPTDDDTQVNARVAAAGLESCWQRWPDEVRDAMALAATYVAMLPPTLDAHIAPWVFPDREDKS